MRRIVFIWTFPFRLGVSWEQIGIGKKVRSYCEELNQYFEDTKTEWRIDLDTTLGELEKLDEEDYDIWVFWTGNQKRYWVYNEILKKREKSTYCLSMTELYNGDITKFLRWLKENE